MKYIITFLAGIAFILLLAAQQETQQNQANLAEVDMAHGYYIFAKSKPLAEYEYLGEVTPGFLQSTEFDNLVRNMVKRAKKRFPKGNALIFTGSISSYVNTTASVVYIEDKK